MSWSIKAIDLCDPLPSGATLKPYTSQAAVQRALSDELFSYTYAEHQLKPFLTRLNEEKDSCGVTDPSWNNWVVVKDGEGNPLQELHGVSACAAIAEDKFPLKVTLKEKLSYFSIRDSSSGPCLGIITRSHLEGVLQAAQAAQPDSPTPTTPTEVFRSDTEMFAFNYQITAGGNLKLDEIMDPTPLTIGEDTPAPRLYAMFSKAGERAACVTSRTGEFRGIISREGLIAHARPPEM